MKGVLKIWIVFTSLLSIIGIFTFWPNYVENELPLFSDVFMVLVFLPSFFILFFSVMSFLLSQLFFRKISFKILISVILYCVSFSASSFIFKDVWSVNMRLLFISLASLVGLIHYLISNVLSFKLNDTKNSDENIWKYN